MERQTGARRRKSCASAIFSGARTKRRTTNQAAVLGKPRLFLWRPAIGAQFTIWIRQPLSIEAQRLVCCSKNVSSKSRTSGVAGTDGREKRNRSRSQNR